MKRQPHAILRPFIESLWVSPPSATKNKAIVCRERALPNGTMSIVLRLSELPIRLVDEYHPAGNDYGYAVVGAKITIHIHVSEFGDRLFSCEDVEGHVWVFSNGDLWKKAW